MCNHVCDYFSHITVTLNKSLVCGHVAVAVAVTTAAHGRAALVLWVKISPMVVLLHPCVWLCTESLQRWREWHMMSFMFINEPPCLSPQSSKECRALHSMAADCCSRVKHACSRNVKVQSSFLSIKSHNESCKTPKMAKLFLIECFRVSIGSAFFFHFCFPSWGKGETWKWDKSISHVVRCWWWGWSGLHPEPLKAVKQGRTGSGLLSLWPRFPVGLGWGVSFGQTEGNRGRAAYACMSLKLAVVFLSHTVGLSSCFHCPSLLPRERREEEREMLLMVHCHKTQTCPVWEDRVETLR